MMKMTVAPSTENGAATVRERWYLAFAALSIRGCAENTNVDCAALALFGDENAWRNPDFHHWG